MLKKAFILLIVVCTILTFHNVVYAKGTMKSSLPATGVKSQNPNFGASPYVYNIIPESDDWLISQWYCSIYNTGSNLYIDGTHTAKRIVDCLKLTLYLQKWSGSNWVDIESWTFSKNNAKSIMDGVFADYESGCYYRSRAVHYAKDGSITETVSSTSSYIYVE